MRYSYNINLDERGIFYADVRNSDDQTVFEIHSQDDGNIDLIEDGFIKHVKDVDGLESYLKSVGILKAKDELISEYN